MAKKKAANRSENRHKGIPIQFYASPEEKALFEEAVEAEVMPSLAAWVRRTLLLRVKLLEESESKGQ